MDTIQRINLKNYIKAIQDEEIHNFIYDKDNVITVQSKNNEFRVCINGAYMIFQNGDLLDYIIDTIDKYIVKYRQKEKIRKILGDDNKVNEEFLKQCKEETDGIFRNESTYDYKKNLRHLKKRYENKIRYINLHNDGKNATDDKLINDGLIEGLETAIHDINDMLDGLEV